MKKGNLNQEQVIKIVGEELDKYEDLDGLNWEIEGYEID